MPKIRKKKGLALYQSKNKRRKLSKGQLSLQSDNNNENDEIVEVTITSGNDNQSTIAYEMDGNLSDILDQISELSSHMISSISTEYSEDEFVDSVLQFLPQPKEDLNMERNNIMNELVEYMSDECNSNQNTNEESEYESNVEREENNHSDEYNYHMCSCHVPQKLQYAVDLIESKETMVPLIKEMDKVGILDDFLLMLQLILKEVLKLIIFH